MLNMIWIMVLAPHSKSRCSFFQIPMFSEAVYVSIKGLKNGSPEEETLWQSVRKERRRIQQAEAKRMKRAAATEEEKDAERARVRERRAKYTAEETAAATRRNTEQRRQARSKAAEGGAEEILIVEVSNNGEVLSVSVPVDVDEDVAPLPELGDVGEELPMQPAAVAQGHMAKDLPAVRGPAQPCNYKIIRERNIAERELAYKKYMEMLD
jgi:hypothetical protein